METVAAVPTRFRLQQLLDEHDPPMAQRELARLSGVSAVTINAISNNRTSRVDLATLDALSKALGVEPGDLIEREPAKRGRGR